MRPSHGVEKVERHLRRLACGQLHSVRTNAQVAKDMGIVRRGEALFRRRSRAAGKCHREQQAVRSAIRTHSGDSRDCLVSRVEHGRDNARNALFEDMHIRDARRMHHSAVTAGSEVEIDVRPARHDAPEFYRRLRLQVGNERDRHDDGEHGNARGEEETIGHDGPPCFDQTILYGTRMSALRQ